MMSAKRTKRRVEEVPEDLDLPVAARDNFEIRRLGEKDEHLFLLDLRTPITITAVSATHWFKLPFSFTLTKRVFYQTTAAGAESADALNIRVQLLHPNNTPEVEYYKDGVVWETGGTRLTGKTYMTPTVIEVIVDGTATNLLYMSLELVVHGIA